MPYLRNIGTTFAAGTLSLCFLSPAVAATPDDLFNLSLEELVNLEVTSVTRAPERLLDTTSAVFVITQDDIERHGIRSIPDALRLAPGLSVLQIDANKWSIGSRGFGGRFANNLLVMLDGRHLYTPTFSGVYWDVQHTLIEEIERIEVIRGPGAVVWGTNAVNGVINIITAKSTGTEQGDVIGGWDPAGGSFAGVRYGNAINDATAYRAFLHYSDGANNELESGEAAGDGWNLLRASVRTDTTLRTSDLSFTAEIYEGEMGNTRRYFDTQPPFETTGNTVTDVSGAFLLLQWATNGSEEQSTSGQVYIDHSDREQPLYAEERLSYSAELQHRRRFTRHELNVGASLRTTEFELLSSDLISFLGDDSKNTVASAYMQDEFWLIPETVSLTAGLKVESNDFSKEDIEWMPTLRMLWKPTERHSLWAAATRAVRSPAIADQATRFTDLAAPLPPFTGLNPLPIPLRQGTLGNPDFESETAVSVEIGARGRLSDRVGYDITLFGVHYDGLRTLATTDPLCLPSGIVVTDDPTCLLTSQSALGLAVFTNGSEGHSHGGELLVDWQARSDLRIRSMISVANDSQNSKDPLSLPQLSLYPSVQGQLQVLWSPKDSLSLSLATRYVEEIVAQGIDSYWQASMNIRLAINARTTLSVGGRNLLESSQQEYRSEINELARIKVQSTAFANLRYSF